MLAEADRQLGRSEPRGTEPGPAATPPWRDRWSDEIVMRRTGLHPTRIEAEMLAQMGRYDEAIERLGVLLVHWPDNLEVRNDLAMVHLRSGHADRAGPILDAILEASPDHPATLANRAVVRLDAATSRDGLARALTDADRALKANPNFAPAHEARARILFQMLDFERAAEAFRAAVRCDARRSDLLVEAGRSQIAQRRFDEAAITFQEAIDRAAALDQAWLGLGIARLEVGDTPGAAAALDQAARLIRPGNPAYAVLQQQLAMLQRAGGAGPSGTPEGRE
jgi:tetratricopeptide (TPR) repeat protein